MTDLGAYKFEIYDASDERHVRFGNDLEALRKAERPVMLPLGEEVMKDHTVGVVISHDDVAVGYNGIIFEYGDGIGEMGGLYIHPDFRGRGLVRPLKSELFKAIRSIDRIKKVITFANSNSLQLNLNLGFRLADSSEIPDNSLAACSGCPEFQTIKKLGIKCCDTILILETEKLPDLSLTDRMPRA